MPPVVVHTLFTPLPENFDYRAVTDRRPMYETTEASQLVLVEGLIPYSTYTVEVNASNSQGFVLSNSKLATMPQGRKYCICLLIVTYVNYHNTQGSKTLYLCLNDCLNQVKIIDVLELKFQSLHGSILSLKSVSSSNEYNWPY